MDWKTLVALVVAAPLTLACSGDDKDDGEGGGNMLTGSITPDEASFSGDIGIAKAFAFDQGGKFLAYMSSDSAATCEGVYDYLGGQDKAYDPVDLFNDGFCNMFVFLGSGYDGGHSATDDNIAAAGSAISCPMGEGEWVYESRDGDDKDYYWDPPAQWWVGHPTSYEWDFSGSGTEGYTLDIEMTDYDGGFPYIEWDNTPASGNVSGTVEAEYCQPLGTLGFW